MSWTFKAKTIKILGMAKLLIIITLTIFTILQEEVPEAAHDVTAASGDITVDSVRDHTTSDPPELNINLQVCLVYGIRLSLFKNVWIISFMK